jgi:Transglycosylase SLT domain
VAIDRVSLPIAWRRTPSGDDSAVNGDELREGCREAAERHPNPESRRGRRNIMHRSGLCLLIASVLVLLPTARNVAATMDQAELLANARQCDSALQAAARATGVPLRLLRALAPVESGLGSRAGTASIAWPWTINANQHGSYHFRTRAAAERHLEALLNAGIDNVDIGCMQVNWHWHRQDFSSPRAVLTPVLNARYAALTLRGYHDRTGSWAKAIGMYHTRNPELAEAYRCRVAQALVSRTKLAGCQRKNVRS